jgi:hypothetical protein
MEYLHFRAECSLLWAFTLLKHSQIIRYQLWRLCLDVALIAWHNLDWSFSSSLARNTSIKIILFNTNIQYFVGVTVTCWNLHKVNAVQFTSSSATCSCVWIYACLYRNSVYAKIKFQIFQIFIALLTTFKRRWNSVFNMLLYIRRLSLSLSLLHFLFLCLIRALYKKSKHVEHFAQ